MLTERDIIKELEQYSAFYSAYIEGKRGSDLPDLPNSENKEGSVKYYGFGIIFHTLLALLTMFSKIINAQSTIVLVARARIKTDRYSWEPCSCGLNHAFTNLGLALLKQGNIDGAIKCLDASWRVHPCPHNTSYGLRRELALSLQKYPKAKEGIREYVRIGKKFAVSSNWDSKFAPI